MSWNLPSGIDREPYLSFDNAALKIEWAAAHLQQLNAICEDFVNRKPYEVSIGKDAAGNQQILQVGMTQRFPANINLLAGDIVSNLRAALDFAWMGLIRSLTPPGAKAHKMTLPIGNDRKSLEATIAKSLVGKTFFEQTKDLLLSRIKSHHDFPSGGNKAICALNELSNWNKHNLLIVALGETSFIGNIGGTSFEGNAFVGGIQNIMAWKGVDRDLVESIKPSFQIVFGDHKFVKNQPLIPTLAELCVSSMDALQAFREVFPISKS